MSLARVPQLKVDRIELPNGMVALLAENRGVPSVTINAVVKTGERYVADDVAGIATLAGALLSHGTARQSASAIAETIESVGGRLTTRGGYATSQIDLTLLSEDLELGLQMAAELLREPVFAVERLSLAVDRRLGELQAHEDDPRWVASTLFNEIVFAGTPQHRPLEGYARTLSRLHRDEVVEFHRRFFVPENTILVIAGDFRALDAGQRIAEIFGEWEVGGPLKFPAVTAPRRQSERIRRVVEKSKEQLSIFVGHLGIARSDKDYFKIRVLDTILGDSPGFTSRIPRILRDERGLAYSVHCHMARSAGVDPGRFVAYIGTAPENYASAVDGLREQIELITREAPATEEVIAAKAYLTGSFVFEFETNAQLAAYLINAELYGLGYDYAQRFIQQIEQVTVDDVFEAACTHIHPEALTEVVVGPMSAADDE